MLVAMQAFNTHNRRVRTGSPVTPEDFETREAFDQALEAGLVAEKRPEPVAAAPEKAPQAAAAPAAPNPPAPPAPAA